MDCDVKIEKLNYNEHEQKMFYDLSKLRLPTFGGGGGGYHFTLHTFLLFFFYGYI